MSGFSSGNNPTEHFYHHGHNGHDGAQRKYWDFLKTSQTDQLKE